MCTFLINTFFCFPALLFHNYLVSLILPLAIYHRLVWRAQLWVPHKEMHTFHPTSHWRRDWRDETQHAMPTAVKCIGGGSLDVVPQSYHASAALKTFPFVFYIALLFYPLSFPSTVEAYLQVSAGVTGRLPSRHFKAALRPTTVRSFPGFVQSTTALLPPSCHPAPSALHCSLSTSVLEGGLCSCV